jgi:serine/threonine-protein kinase
VESQSFFDYLRVSRVLPEAEVQRLQARFGGKDPEKSIAPVLIAEKLLTPFQARLILGGEPHRLVMGQYRLLDELGRGGMGSVYKALHTVMGRVVAVKVILSELMQVERAIEWFRREVQALTQLQHPNIVMAFDANEADGVHFLVMEYVDGPNLDVMVRRDGPLAPPFACEVIREAALGLEYAHQKGMVHRDIKPANLLIPRAVSDGPTPSCGKPALVKLVDFGLARLHSQTQGMSVSHKSEAEFLGTPDFCSPEQCQDMRAVDVRSDLYSLGCTFYFALTGKVPFPADTALEKMLKHVLEEPRRVDELQPGIPTSLAAIVHRLMAKDPDRRFETAAELAEELVRYCALGEKAACVAGCEIPEVAPGVSPSHLSGGQNAPPTRILDKVGIVYCDDEESRRPLAEENCTNSEPRAEKNTPDTIRLLVGPPATPAACLQDSAAERTHVEPNASIVQAAKGVDLLRPWRDWAAVVERVANRKGSLWLTDGRYRAVREKLLAALSEAGADPQRAAYVERLGDVVRPWLTLKTLCQTDPPILKGLLQWCRQIECELGRGRGQSLLGYLRTATVLFVVPTVAWIWFCAYGSRWLGSLSTHASGWTFLPARGSLQAFFRFMDAHPMYWPVLYLPMLAALFLLWLWRATRT